MKSSHDVVHFIHGLSSRLRVFFVASFSTGEAGELVAEALKPSDCLEQLDSLIESTAPKFWAPPDQQRYDLLICSTVLTQLQATVRESVERVFLELFPEYAAALSNQEPWRKSAWNFARNLEDAFIDHLGAMIKPRGIVYLSATVHVSWLAQLEAQSVAIEGNWIATRTPRLADYLRLGDTIIEERHWNWLREDREGDFWGRLYGVQAIIYRIE